MQIRVTRYFREVDAVARNKGHAKISGFIVCRSRMTAHATCVVPWTSAHANVNIKLLD